MLASALAPIFLTSFVGLLLLMPGVLVCSVIFKRELDFVAKFVIGCAIGLVLLLYVNVLLSVTTGINRTGLIVALISLYFVSLLVAYKGGLRFPSWKQFSISRTQSLLLLVLLWAIIVRSLPLFFSEFPLGWDTTFHCLISKIVAMKGAIPSTWEPFEKTVLNYPWGSHVFIADISLLSGLEIHQVFSVLITVFFGGLSVLAVYMLSRQFFARETPAILAALSYGFLANLGSLNYYAWGGLPNQIGMFLFLCVSSLYLRENLNLKKKILACAFLLSGIILVHNHSMITCFFIFAFFAVITILSQRKFTEDARRIVSVVALSLVFSSFYCWHLFTRLFNLQATGVLQFQESINIFKVPLSFGILLFIFGLVGFAFYQPKNSGKFIYLLSWLVSLLFAFALCYYVWKAITTVLYYPNYSFVAFTPSRFLTDMAYPLSIFSGYGIYVIFTRLRGNYRGLAILLSVSLTLIPLYYVIGFCRSALPPQVIQVAAWVEKNTPREALIINEGQHSDWIPFLTGREVTHTPLPVTEIASEYINEDIRAKYDLTRLILGEEKPKHLSKENLIAKFKRRPVYLYASKEFDRHYAECKFESGSLAVHEVDLTGLSGTEGGSI